MTDLRTLAESSSEVGKDVIESVEGFGRSASKKLADARDDTGAALHSAATSARRTGRRTTEAIDNVANAAGKHLDATASCVEDLSLNNLVRGIENFARKHVVGSLVAAVAIGFLTGSAFRRGDKRAD